MNHNAPSRKTPETHQRRAEKLSRIPVKIEHPEAPLPKPDWLRIKLSSNSQVSHIKQLLRQHNLHTVCEEAACPNLAECFQQGTATFMIMGDICTRRCPFCDVAHGKPLALNPEEPKQIARAIEQLQLNYVVITSVDRDDLRDGGASHFAECIKAIRELTPITKIEILVPDFRGRLDKAIQILSIQPCDVFNHNLETVPRLYKKVRPGADYENSLKLLENFHFALPNVPTKSGLMLGLGEQESEVLEVLRDLLQHGCSMITLGQYLQPSKAHLPVNRYLSPDEFTHYGQMALALGFKQVASAPLVRSSYHADHQARQILG